MEIDKSLVETISLALNIILAILFVTSNGIWFYEYKIKDKLLANVEESYRAERTRANRAFDLLEEFKNIEKEKQTKEG